MALDQAAHHLGLARRTEGGAGFLRLLHRDQAVDDVAALHQEAVHGLVDAVDLAPQIGERGGFGTGWGRLDHGTRGVYNAGQLIGGGRRESKENIDSRERRPI